LGLEGLIDKPPIPGLHPNELSDEIKCPYNTTFSGKPGLWAALIGHWIAFDPHLELSGCRGTILIYIANVALTFRKKATLK
jgi:hypothetical protein